MLSQKINAAQSQKFAIAPRQLQALNLLAKNLPELRAEILSEMATNPAIEDVEHNLETPLSEIGGEMRSDIPDYPEDDFVPGISKDEEDVERRQAFFDKQVKTETLQSHLLAQLPLSDIPEKDWPAAEALVSNLNDDGFYKGSIADMQMAYALSEDEVLALLGKIRELDPPGCGSITAKDCLLAQIGDIEDAPRKEIAKKIIERHIEAIAAREYLAVAKSLSVSEEEVKDALALIRSLNPHPGRLFPGEKERVEYINPEVHAIKRKGRWCAETDERSLPEIKISQLFRKILSDPTQSQETKAYVAERIESAEAFRKAVSDRQKTVSSIAQAIFDRQQEFFEKGIKALKPLTGKEIAEKVGVSGSTVSRTVKDKYASTPQGTMELRRFFSSGVKTSAGESVSQDVVLRRLRSLVDAENKSSPLSDDALAKLLKESGFPMARRTVAKYRDKLGIPKASERNCAN